MGGILEGIRMVDLGWHHNGVAAGYMLGDLGADIIKIEDPVTGDASRGRVRQYGDIMSYKGRLISFETANRNKRGITLDLKKEQGREVLYRMVKTADVFYSNFRREVLARLGADYETLRRHNPRLVYGISTAFGSQGAWGQKRAFDPVGMAYSGAMWMMGDRDDPEPVQIVGGIFDQMGASMMAYGILAALVRRERTGEGVEFETSLLGNAIHLQAMSMNVSLIRGRSHARHSRKRARNPMANHYRCGDGEWIMMSEPSSDLYWHEFCQVMGLQEMEQDPRFATALARRESYAEVIEAIDRAFASKTRDEWLNLFAEKGVRFACSPIKRQEELANDPQLLLNKYIVDWDHPIMGPVKAVGFPVNFIGHPAAIQREAPEHGQHTEEVLLELGYSWDEIAQMRSDGVI